MTVRRVAVVLCAHSDLVNSNTKYPWPALQSAGAVTIDSSVHYEGKKRIEVLQ